MQVFKDRYQVELVIPFKSLGFPNPKSMGKDWGINLCRTNMAFKEWTCWSPTLGTFHNSSRFGNVTEMDVNSTKIYQDQQVENNKKQLVLTLDRTFYDTQVVASLKYRLRIKKQLKSCIAEIIVKNSKQKIVFSKRVERILFTNRAQLPIKKWNEDKYSVAIRILDKKKNRFIVLYGLLLAMLLHVLFNFLCLIQIFSSFGLLILIASMWMLINKKIRKAEKDSPYAPRSFLGWKKKRKIREKK